MRSFNSGKAKAALFLGTGQPMEIIEADIPVPGQGEILVETECCAICSSDLHTHGGRRIEPVPTVLGHEIIGRIMSFGSQATTSDARGETLAVGDRITWTVAASCGQCINCRDGLEQKCARLVKYGHEKVTREMPFRGGMAEVVLLSPGTGIVRLPSTLPHDVPLEVMTLANCSTATVAAVLKAAFSRRNRPSQSVVVLGTGVLGLTACAMARSLYSAAVVIAVDRDPERANRALKFGATHACTDLNQLKELACKSTCTDGVDASVELAGSIVTANAAVAVARTGGTVVLAGTTMPTDPLTIEPQMIVRRLLRVEGVHNYITADLISAVDFLLGAGRTFPMRSLIAGRCGLSEMETAFNEGHKCPGSRIVVLPSPH